MMTSFLFAIFGACLVSSSPLEKIIGGQDAYPGQFPWQASMQFKGSHSCGAVLINPTQVLTAAHCTDKRSIGDLTIVLGDHNRLHSDGTEQTFSVVAKHEHPGYTGGSNDEGTFGFDIAVLDLHKAADTSGSAVSTIGLASANADFTGVTCTISGWGLVVGSDEALPNTLQHVSMPVIANNECQSRHFFASIGSGHICIYKSGKGACNGDSGGPMICNGVLAGVTSWGSGGCPATTPSVYTRISYYLSWINSQ